MQQPRSYHNALDERLEQMRREEHAALPWALAYSFALSNPDALKRRWLTQKLLEDAISHALPDTERELKGIFKSLARRLGSRRLARNILEGLLSHVRL